MFKYSCINIKIYTILTLKGITEYREEIFTVHNIQRPNGNNALHL